MQSHTHNFLRRTAAALAAVAGFTLVSSLDAQAAAGTVSLSNGQSCAYSAISIDPLGGLSVTCTSGGITTPAPGGTFTIYGASAMDGTQNQYLWYSVARAGSTTGAATLNLNVTGGCTLSPNNVSFADGEGSYKVFGVVAPQDGSGKVYNTTCVVSIQQQSPAITLGNPPPGLSIAVTGPGTAPGGGGGTVANCPAIPSDAVNLANGSATNINYGGNSFIYLKSGQIGYTTLPQLSAFRPAGVDANTAGYGSAKIQIAQTTASPRDGTYEISIGRCPGVIDTTGSGSNAGNNAGTCYRSGPTMPSIFSLSWFENVGVNGASSTDAQASLYAMCEAYASKGTWYVNVRYNYTNCGYGTCDYMINWNWDYPMP